MDGDRLLRMGTMIGLALILSITLLPLSASAASTQGPPETTHGYSVFDETIVDMTWPEVEKAAKEEAIVLFPTAVIEEHGTHMALGVDTYLAYIKCKLIRRKLESRGIQTIVAPPFYWGINNNSGGFPGSFTVRRETMKAVLHDTLACFERWGFGYVFIVNHHGDMTHNRSILEAVEEARINTGVRAYYILRTFDAKVVYRLTGKEPHVLLIPMKEEPGPRSKYLDIHAGQVETGMMAYYYPDQVDLELARTLKSTDLTFKDLWEWDPGWSDARRITPLGYFGDPASFDPHEGKEKIEEYATEVAALIEEFIKKK